MNRMLKISLFVIFPGSILLGVILAFTFSHNGNFLSFDKANISWPNTLSASLEIDPPEISTTSPLVDFKKSPENIIKSTIKVKYKNNTNVDLTSVQVWVSVENGKKYNFLTSETAKYIRGLPRNVKTGVQETIFLVSDIRKGQTNTADIYIYSRVRDELKISARIINLQGKTAKTNTETLIIR